LKGSTRGPKRELLHHANRLPFQAAMNWPEKKGESQIPPGKLYNRPKARLGSIAMTEKGKGLERKKVQDRRLQQEDELFCYQETIPVPIQNPDLGGTRSSEGVCTHRLAICEIEDFVPGGQPASCAGGT